MVAQKHRFVYQGLTWTKLQAQTAAMKMQILKSGENKVETQYKEGRMDTGNECLTSTWVYPSTKALTVTIALIKGLQEMVGFTDEKTEE